MKRILLSPLHIVMAYTGILLVASHLGMPDWLGWMLLLGPLAIGIPLAVILQAELEARERD